MTYKVDNLQEVTDTIKGQFLDWDTVTIEEGALIDTWDGLVATPFKIGRYKFSQGQRLETRSVYLSEWSSGLELWRDGKRLMIDYVDYAELANAL